MAGGGIVSHGSQNKKGGLKALLAALLALFALSLSGCRDVSQKDSWIVQAVLEAPGETVRLGLLCRSVGPGESEEKWSLFTARAEDEGKALDEIQQQAGGKFYFGHCEYLLLEGNAGREGIRRASAFWRKPERGCGNLRVYEYQAGAALLEKEDTDWQALTAGLSRLEEEGSYRAYAYRLSSQDSPALVPLLAWEGEKGLLTCQGLDFYREGDTEPRLWEGNLAALAALLDGQTHSVVWQGEGGSRIQLEPALITYRIQGGKDWSLSLSLDAFVRLKTGEERRAGELEAQVQKELEELISQTWAPGADVFGFGQRFGFADSRRAAGEGRDLYSRQVSAGLLLWE